MKYIALTIGPIYKTLSNAKKTRELWGGSYLFSYIMKQIVTHFKERDFVVPYTKNDAIFTQKEGVGLFHDRMIFEAKQGDEEKLYQVIETVLKELAEGMGLSYAFLRDYLQIHVVSRELEEGANPILEITPYLDSAELFYRVGQADIGKLSHVLKNNNSFLTKEAFGGKKSFPSLPEIALHDMLESIDKQDINAEDEESIFEMGKYTFRPYHKYYAVIHADGDSMGKVIEKLASKKAFQDFSGKLFEYANASQQKIKAYGGETIFAGGDDLLFFAPVVSGERNIFDLCDEISADFNERFGGTEATLSLGVAIQYHKFPLYEALEQSRKLLFDDAKGGKKNSIAFSVTKHSGQHFGAVIHKGDEALYAEFRKLVSSVHSKQDMENFLHSIHHKIETNKAILAQIASDKNRLQHFFDNYFNEAIHDSFYRSFFAQLADFIHEAYRADRDNALKSVYATLRFIKFVQGDKA